MFHHSMKFTVSLALFGSLVPSTSPEAAAAQSNYMEVKRTEESVAEEATRVLSNLAVVVLDRITDARLRAVATRIVVALKRLASTTDKSMEAAMLANLSLVIHDAKVALDGTGRIAYKCEKEVPEGCSVPRYCMPFAECLTLGIWGHNLPEYP